MTSAIDIAPDMRAAIAQVNGQHGSLDLERIIVGHGALERLPEQVASVAGLGPVVILEDRTPMRRGRDDLKVAVYELLAGASPPQRVILGPEDGSLHADEKILSDASEAVRGAGCVVTVGSGTLTDIGKYSCHAGGGIPLVAVQTAASVNGFADGMAVVLKDGVKRTLAAVWPSVLLIDTLVLRDAPKELTRSGYAEMMAMLTAPADWRLASLTGVDTSYRQSIVDLYRPLGQDFLGSASAVSNREDDALESLASLLTVSGIAMGVAGQSAPLSGTEHLISHMLDMSANATGVPAGLHGAQVGVSAAIASVIWKRLLDRLDPEALALRKSNGDAEGDVRSAFGWIDKGGAATNECWADYQKKLATWIEVGGAGRLAKEWAQASTELKALVVEPEMIIGALRASGAPTRFSELDPPVDKDRARWAVASCHLMRSRFTVVDLANLAGHWSIEDVNEVIEEATELGGGW